ncbi:MAG: redoxin domain-containing protein [Negativicutes bacterium]|nr:redoxin domain-containing protein [Negativicutes bacterium]
MPREQAPLLDAGDLFPALKLTTVDRKTLSLPTDLAGKWTVLLFYRGGW